MFKIRQTTNKFTLKYIGFQGKKLTMSVSAGPLPLCHGSSADITEEMAAKELCDIQLDYQVRL